MILSIQNYYNAPSPCVDLCAPLQKYHAFFADQNEEPTGFSKIALTIAWIATGFFAYPIFGLLAAVGVAIKIATGQQAGVDPIDMTAEELQVWGQDPSVTTERWNEVQSKKVERFLDEIASSKGNLPASGTYYGGPRVDPEPWDQAGIWWGDHVYWRFFPIKDGDAFEETLASIKTVKQAVAEGLKNETNRIEARYMYRLGGEPESKGMVFVDVRKMAEVAVFDLSETDSQLPAPAPRSEAPSAPRTSVGNSVIARDPIKMSEVQLRAWGEDPSVTVQQWNDVQWERINRFLERGALGDLKGLPRWDGPVTQEGPSSWLQNPWRQPAYDGWCFLQSQEQMAGGCNSIAALRDGVQAALNLATTSGKKVQARYLYQSETNSGSVAYVQCRRIKS